MLQQPWCTTAAEFPDAITKGYTLHYSSAIWHKVQELGLLRNYMVKQHLHKFVWYIYKQLI